MNNSQPSPTGATPAVAWKQRYEALRQTAVPGGQALGVEPFGFVLLVRQGVANWMHSWPRPAETAREPALPLPSVPPPPQWQQHLTTLLAQMSLAHLSSLPL